MRRWRQSAAGLYIRIDYEAANVMQALKRLAPAVLLPYPVGPDLSDVDKFFSAMEGE